MEQDYEASAEWFQKAAKARDVVAEHNLASLKESGFGVNRDLPKAGRLLRLAAAGGLVQAESELARLDYSGRGVPPNDAEAATLLQDCVKKGCSFEKNLRSESFTWKGKHFRTMMRMRLHYFADAAGYENNAALNVAVMLFRGQGTKQDFASARWWAIKAIEKMPNNYWKAFRQVEL